MTVCISAICQDGNTIIVASDRMVTTSLPPIEFEHTKPKIYSLSSHCVIQTAGNALRPIEIVPKIQLKVAKAKTTVIEQISHHAKDIYQLLRANHAEDLYLRPRTITKEVFFTDGLRIFPPDLFRFIDREFTSFRYGVSLIISGFDNSAHIYSINDPGVLNCFDTIGFHAIGIGDLHAIQVFISHNYRTSYNLEEAISVVYAAKKAAEAAPGVGQVTDIFIITSDGITSLPIEIINKLSEIYTDIRKSPIEEIKEKSKRLRSLFEKQISKNKEEQISENKKEKDNESSN